MSFHMLTCIMFTCCVSPIYKTLTLPSNDSYYHYFSAITSLMLLINITLLPLLSLYLNVDSNTQFTSYHNSFIVKKINVFYKIWKLVMYGSLVYSCLKTYPLG